MKKNFSNFHETWDDHFLLCCCNFAIQYGIGYVVGKSMMKSQTTKCYEEFLNEWTIESKKVQVINMQRVVTFLSKIFEDVLLVITAHAYVEARKTFLSMA